MKKYDKIAVCLFTIAFIIAIKNFVIDQKAISEFDGITAGEIVDYKHENLTWYKIIYKFKIDEKEYKGELGVTGDFICNDGTRGCVGKEFKVSYLKKNPNRNRIDLGKYKKYQTTVDFN